MKWNINGKLYPVDAECRDGRIFLRFRYNEKLIKEVKSFQGAKWHGHETPPIKAWSVVDNLRNQFRIRFLCGEKVYENYDKPLIEFKSNRKLFDHQIGMVQHGITRQYCVIAAEMSTGKTLSSIEIMEWLARNKGTKSWFYVAPKSALVSVKDEFELWQSSIIPQFFTYEGLVKVVQAWPENVPPPQGVIFDEASKVKTPTAIRTKVAQYLADNIRRQWGDKGAVILMTGTPAPKGPTDWWSLCEIACPGFLKEGDVNKLRERLCILEEQASEAGGMFKKVVTWKDDTAKCLVCGQDEKHFNHELHPFVPSVNEVALLHERMKGLTISVFKKDVQKHLPPKIFKRLRLTPSQEILNAAKLIAASSTSAVRTLTYLRELSDGFQYHEEITGTETCTVCNGNRTVEDWVCTTPEEMDPDQAKFEKIMQSCLVCSGTGEVDTITRKVERVATPKIDALKDVLDDHEEVGRIVIYAAFTGSIDLVVNTCLEAGWAVVRVDGRGWHGFKVQGDSRTLYRMFKGKEIDKIAFVGHPGSGGMGLNLQNSPTILFYSNDFNGESRMQALERIHRPGMDIGRGSTIIDLINLPTDEYILENLDAKRNLQALTMGEIVSKLGVKNANPEPTSE